MPVRQQRIPPSAAAPDSSAALPTFFIIGAPKAGTTSLHNYLAEHHEIQMSAVKEPNFFAPHLDLVHEPRRVGELEKYEQLFDPSVAVRGEASTPYTEYPLRQGVPERIKALVPEAKLIYVVRDPIARTVSHYNHLVASEGERRPLTEVLSDLDDPRSPSICASLYALQLELYLRHFDREQILVVDQANLLKDRHSTLRGIFRFLGVDNRFDSPRFDSEFLKATDRRTYPPAFARFVELRVVPRLRWLSPGARRFLRHSVERALFPSLQPSELDDGVRARLQDYYRSEVERLRALTGMAFPSWSV